MTVEYTTYWKIKKNFLERHNSDFKVETSPMDEYGRYHKEYICSDGAIFYEVMSPEYEKQTVEFDVKYVHVKKEIEVKLFKTEFWSSDDSISRSYYEIY